MNLLVFSELYYPHGSGAELATHLYCQMLAKRGFKVTIVTTHFSGERFIEKSAKGITIHRLPIKTWGYRYDTLVNCGILGTSFIRNLILENDVIYIPGYWYSVLPIAKAYKKKTLVHLHNYSIACSTSLMFDFVKKEVAPASCKSFIFHEKIERGRAPLSIAASAFLNELIGKQYNRLGTVADAFVFVSNSQKNLIQSQLPQITEKSYMVYNPLPDIPAVGSEQKGIGYFGGRRFIKGYGHFLEVIKSLENCDFPIFMTMTSPTQKFFKTPNGLSICSFPKLDSSHFLCMLKKLSIVVLPSQWPEPLPYALIESMLYGKLVIASNIGGIPEILDNSLPGGRLTAIGDQKGIIKALKCFLSYSLAETNEIGLKNRQFIRQKFNNEKTITSFIQVLDDLQSCPV